MPDLIRNVSFPFESDRFPPELGAVVQRSIVKGEKPARVVIHDDENDWLVSDGIGDPNGDSVLFHIAHLADRDPAIAELASLPIGYVAFRSSVRESWQIDRFEYGEE
ncbi:hypothetical protein ACGFW5_30450 [Streptomyces sp. NPDC048416]|uniref:hypothetical protein n=1 Tax=Streptomyces sp. NPDC048416 TaxID=3365546 RepID=UPI003715C5C2